MRKPVWRARARLECALGRSCARPTGGTYGRTTGTPILLISIRSPLKKQRGAEHPEGYPGQITYSTRCNDDTAPECTRSPPRRPATRARARGSASRRSKSNLLARALERRNAPLRCGRDPRQVGAHRALNSWSSTSWLGWPGSGRYLAVSPRGHFYVYIKV